MIDHKFKLADSLYTIKPPSEYKKYIQKSFWHGLLVSAVTKKEKDGKYHFRYFEKHYFSPKKKYHYDGQVFILIGGNSFSATTLFAGDLKGQKNITPGRRGNRRRLLWQYGLDYSGCHTTEYRSSFPTAAFQNGDKQRSY